VIRKTGPLPPSPVSQETAHPWTLLEDTVANDVSWSSLNSYASLVNRQAKQSTNLKMKSGLRL
jgi:hypothetical protein